MKLECEYKASCCKKEFVGPYEREVTNWLLSHIKSKHKGLYKKLEKKGMKLARSQNGCGYFDIRGEGWKKAQPNFRRAWITQALENLLNNK